MSPFSTPVQRYMTPKVFSVGADQDLAEADRLMREHHVSCLPVLGRDGHTAGVISHTDLVRMSRVRAFVTGRSSLLELPAMCAGDAMSPRVIAVAPSATLGAAARRMVDERVHRLFVLDGAALVGVLSTKDVMRAVVDARVPTPLSQFMTSPVASVDVGERVGRALEMLEQSRISGVLVTEDEAPAGIFTQLEALAARDLANDAVVEQAMSASLLCLPLSTPLFRAAAFAVSTRARRVLAIEHHHVRGILTGLDFARAAASPVPAPELGAASG